MRRRQFLDNLSRYFLIIGGAPLLPIGSHASKFTDRDKLFFIKTQLKFRDPIKQSNFISKYLQDPAWQLHNLSNTLPVTFWSNHAKEVDLSIKNKQLIYRAVFQRIDLNCMEVLNIWKKREDYISFDGRVNGFQFNKAMEEIGLQTHYIQGELTRLELNSFVESHKVANQFHIEQDMTTTLQKLIQPQIIIS